MTKLSLRLPLLALAVLMGVGLLLAGSGRFARPLVGGGTPEPVGLSYAGEIGGEVGEAPPGPIAIIGPVLETVAAVSFDGDLRRLPPVPASPDVFRPELEMEGNAALGPTQQFGDQAAQPPRDVLAPTASMPATIQNFDGLDRSMAGGGFYPPDTNGDVGFGHYIQTINTAIAIYSKTGTLLAPSFTFNALFSGTDTPCDTNNNGDPVVLFDAQFNRWLVADFAWIDNDNGPYYECIAVSKTSDPVAGGWWFYALRADDAGHNFLHDYPKLGVWPDGIYMSANMFDLSNNGSSAIFQGVRVWALNRDDLYSGADLRSVHFDTTSSFFGLLPSNFRGASPPAGRPNYFVSNDRVLFKLDVFKFHVDWTTPANSTFTGPTQVSIDTYNPPVAVPQPGGGNTLDSLLDRLMVQNQYKNVGGIESVWLSHTAGDSATGINGVRWYQLNVTAATVNTTPVQQGTYRPDSDHRWMPSLAVDRQGNMAIGYSVASSTLSPTIRYAGRLVTDTLNLLPQDETTLIAGAGVQSNMCGGGPCHRWGDYSAMTVDPSDDCTFWYTTEYYSVSNGNWRTRIGSFLFPGCPIVYTDHLYLPLIMR